MAIKDGVLDLFKLRPGQCFDVHVPPAEGQVELVKHVEILTIIESREYRPVQAKVTTHSEQRAITYEYVFLDRIVTEYVSFCQFIEPQKGGRFISYPIDRIQMCDQSEETSHFFDGEPIGFEKSVEEEVNK